MIKLIDLLNEDDFQSEEPSSFPNEQEVIQDYIDELPSEGTTMPDVMEDAKDYNHVFQLKLLMAIAENGLLNLSNSNIKIKPDGVLQMFNTQSDIAYDALANYNLNEAFFIGEDQDITCEECNHKWNTKDSDKSDKYICHICGHDNSDQIDEYDVNENNLYEVKDFIRFIKEYKTFLTEASCNCVTEAEYHGRKVQLGKPMQGDIKKFKVYVKNNKGKVVKVNFGFGGKSAKGKRMNIKVNNPKRRAAYRARHHCNNPGPRTSANYWSCRKW
jgi:DNA-directed RNA polymerase subunit RPC12/RpoP